MTDQGSIIQEVLDREEQRYEAQIAQDDARMREILDDDLRYTHNNGLVDDKEGFIKLAKTIHYLKVERTDLLVKVYGETAVVTGVARITVDRGDQIRHSHLRYVNVWVKRASGWRNVLWQSTAIPA